MKLQEALRLKENARLALVGAGGKSSALFRLAYELKASGELPGLTVWLSATTHLSHDQLKLADRHVQINNLHDFERYLKSPSTGIVLFTGPNVEVERTAGVELDILDEIKLQADADHIPLLLEADGSRRLPLKAPAEHEPVIPAWIDQVVVVAGLSALGKPLTHDWVHRPEIFSKISGIGLGETITPEAIVKVLASPFGGLKGIPCHAQRILLLNQVYSEEQKKTGQWMASQLKRNFHSIILAQIKPPLGVGAVLAVNQRVAGIVLAAGASSRLGRPKQLLVWRGKALVQHVVEIAVEAGLDPVIVVTGHASQEVRRLIENLPVIIVENQNWQAGQGLSVASGIRAIPEGVGAAILLLSDQPMIPVELVRKLVATHAECLDPILAPSVNSKRSNPVLFDCRLFEDLSLLDADIGGRALFRKYPVSLITWRDGQFDLDVDTEDDYFRLLSMD